MRDAGSGRENVAPDLLAHYASGVELERLALGRSQLERARTEELLRRHLPPPPATILDVGGGPGVYAYWLAAQGYVVHLVDAVSLHLEQARQVAQQRPDCELASIRLGDARALDQAPECVDAVLLLGPLYHLTERAQRLAALREARRVVRPGGVIFAVGISRFASLLDGLASDFLDDPAFVRIVEQDLRSGQHRNPANHPAYFTTAYFHHPDELQDEVRVAELDLVEIVGIEGPGGWLVLDFDAWWEDSVRRERLLAAARAVEHEPALLGLGPHIMAVTRRT